MLDSSADVGDSPCSQSDLAVHPELQIDRAYKRSLMPCMQMHAHLQAAALRCYPGRKLLSPWAAERYRSYQTQRHEIQVSLRHPTERSGAKYEKPIDIRTWSSPAWAGPKFDLAQVWMMHSPTSYAAAYGFRRALLGEPQDSPITELDVAKYQSLVILRCHEHDARGNADAAREKSKFRVAMNAEDILKFMLSDFARKGTYDEIFEDDVNWTGPPELVSILNDGGRALPPPATEHAPPSACLSPSSPRKIFAAACVERMRDLEENLHESAALEFAEDHSHKRRRLATSTLCQITRVLFDANKMVLDALL